MSNSKANATRHSAGRLAEFRFLCAVINESGGARAQPDPADVSDWHRLVRVADGWLVSPALYRGLQRLGLGAALPDQLLEYLQATYELNRERNIRLMNQVREFMPVLARSSIKAVLLKGAASLASGLYRDPGTRMLSDIDILVDVDDLSTAAELFYQLDYQFTKPSPVDDSYSTVSRDEGLTRTGRSGRGHHLPPLIHATHPASVEVHEEIGRPSKHRLRGEEILHEAVAVRYDGLAVHVPSIGHRIIHNFDHCQIKDLTGRSFMTNPRQLHEFVLLVDTLHGAQAEDDIHAHIARHGGGLQYNAYLRRAHNFFGLRLAMPIRQRVLPRWHLQLGTLFIRKPSVGHGFRRFVTVWRQLESLSPTFMKWRDPGMSLPAAYWARVKRLLYRMMLKRNISRRFAGLFAAEP